MKIIERGQLPEKKVYKERCTNCQTLFEFERHEIKLSPDPRDLGSIGLVSCPLCSRDVWVTI